MEYHSTDMGHLGGFSELKKEFGELQTDEVIIVSTQRNHILQSHPETIEDFDRHAKKMLSDPDMIIRELNRDGTAHFVLTIPGHNLKAIVRVALADDTLGNRNTILSFQYIRQRNLNKLIAKNKVIYRKQS